MDNSTSVSVYCQEPINPPREDGLRIAVITDGNGRRGREGHAAGARNVVRCAEHCRDRRDVALFCALLLSPENVRSRGEPFFAKMHVLFIRLVADVLRGRALAGVRFELYGSLDTLKRRGGAARRLGHAIELFLEAGQVAEPRMRFVIGVDYDAEIISALHLDLVVRTGMESANLVRLSGLRPHPSAACVATRKLWCEFEPHDLDEAITVMERRPPAAFAPGYDESFVAGFIVELLRARIRAPLRIVLPVAAPEPSLLAALEQLARGPLGEQTRLAVDYASSQKRRPLRFGPKGETCQSILLLSPGRRGMESEGSYTALLAPGQPSSVWKLPDMPLGYASGHGCAPTPRGLVEGLRAALRFHHEHPPLRGRDRVQPAPANEAALAAWPPHIQDLMCIVGDAPCSPAEDIARALAGREAGADCQLAADVFAARELTSAISRGILSTDAHWKRAALNYCYTGFAIPFRIPEPSNPTGANWEPLARHVTRFMLAVAASDEEITDRVFAGETEEDRRSRLAVSERFLRGVLRGDAADAPPPVHSAARLTAVARHLEEMRAHFKNTSSPLVFDGFCRAMVGLLKANLSETSPTVTDNPFVGRLGSPRTRARARVAIELRYAARAPGCIGDRIHALLVAGHDHDHLDDATREVRLLCYLIDVAPGIGAGATFRAAALWTPSEAVTPAMAIALDRVATLVDYRFRLANDLSDLHGSAHGDRDVKENAWTILIPKRSRRRERELALVRAVIACEEAASWLDGALGGALRELDELWPSMAAMVRRGIHVGRRVYSMGHYAEVSRLDIGAILDELELAAVTRVVSGSSGSPPAHPANATRAA
jgi:hypothetical protein